MNRLTQEQRDTVLADHQQGLTVSQIAKRRGLLREYVQAYVRYLNRQGI